LAKQGLILDTGPPSHESLLLFFTQRGSNTADPSLPRSLLSSEVLTLVISYSFIQQSKSDAIELSSAVVYNCSYSSDRVFL